MRENLGRLGGSLKPGRARVPVPCDRISLETSHVCLGSGAVVLNITGQEPTEVPELWPCVVSGSVRVVAVVARNKQRHGQPNFVLL